MDIRFVATSGYQLWPCEAVAISGTCGYGSIELEEGWQLIAMDVRYGYWDSSTHQHVHDGTTVAKFKNYVLDQIEDLYGTGKVEVANTYTGDQQAFYSYVVGSTPDSSPNNFQLVYEDNGNYEISGFWIKTLASGIDITWGE